MAALTLEKVSKSYRGTTALADLSIEVADGELLVLVGPSGSGKSTTLRLVAGLEQPDAGEIRIGERAVTRLAPATRNVAMVFQSYALFPHMTVGENLGFGLAVRRAPPAEARARVAAVAETLGITALLDRRPRELSGGERQRVALGRAMIREPDAFLMDEPLSNLDAQLRVQTRAEIVRLQARLRTTTLYVTHDQVEALSIGHRIGVLRDGALEQLGPPQRVYERPESLFVARFIGSPPMNLFPGVAAGRDVVWAGGGIPLAFQASGEVVVGIRPEHVHVRGSRWSGEPPSETVAASLVVSEPVGDQVLLALEVAGHAIVARAEPAFAPRPGERLEIWFDPARVHLFDPATERAIGPEAPR